MGINKRTLQQFIAFQKEGIFNDVKAIFELGSQEVFCEGEEEIIKELFDAFRKDITDEAILRIARKGSAREVYEKLGFIYNCIDTDGQFGALPIDLNYQSVPSIHLNFYDFVTNFGTTEHIANQLNCFKVMHDLTKPGGYMYHELICSGLLNHGLVNYNPKMFWMLCKSNFYDYVGMWLGADTKNPDKLPENIVQNCRYIDSDTLENFATQSAYILVLVRKVFDLPFVAPLDGDLSGTTEEQKQRYWTLSDPDAYKKISHLRYQVNPYSRGDQESIELSPSKNANQSELEQLQIKIKQAQEEIAAMQTSKFWKLRTQWFKIKKFIGLPV